MEKVRSRLAKRAEIFYKSQNPAEQRRLLETVLSNCTFDRGVFAPLTISHSTCSSVATKQEIGGVDGTRARSPSPQDAAACLRTSIASTDRAEPGMCGVPDARAVRVGVHWRAVWDDFRNWWTSAFREDVRPVSI
jgi:hypothetical protein